VSKYVGKTKAAGGPPTADRARQAARPAGGSADEVRKRSSNLKTATSDGGLKYPPPQLVPADDAID
jgi:hypothetical protein